MASRLTSATEEELFALYRQYTDSFKPLVALVEVKAQEFPGPVLNELRAVNDHVSRCFSDLDETQCHEEIEKAKGHLVRGMLDCYKLLLVFYELDVKEFYNQYKDVNLAMVSDGAFLPELRKRHDQATEAAVEAKIEESKSFPDKCNAYAGYQKAVVAYEKVLRYISSSSQGLAHARQYARKQTLIQIFFCVLSAFLGWLFAFIKLG